MNATKRKFNALLSGIGNKSSTSLSSAKEVNNADINGEAKKRRISDSSSIEKSGANNSNILQVKARLLAKSSMAMSHKPSKSVASTVIRNTDTPKYAPWDRTEFLKRLKSFANIADWTPKPPRVNEVEWAKRGWVCQKFERVRCSLCNVEVLVKLNKKEVDGKEEDVFVAKNIEDALVDKYAELIISSHEENCLWRKRGCDDSMFRMPLNHTPTTLHTLRERYDELCTRSEHLPYSFNIRTPPEFDLDSVLSYLPQDFFTAPVAREDEPAPKLNRVAFIMALFGWQDHRHDRLGNQPKSVSCHVCFRTLGLWIFKSKQVNEAGEEVASPIVSCLDVVTEHRDYCPWRNAASQNGQKPTETPRKSALAGWEIVLRGLKNDHYLRHGNRSNADRAPESPTADPFCEIDSIKDDIEDTKSRDEEDKKRWARLRRVKSLFDTKGGRKKRTEFETQNKPS